MPEMNFFWRSMDIYSDHMVRRYDRVSSRSNELIRRLHARQHRYDLLPQDARLEGGADPVDGARRLVKHGVRQPGTLSDDDAHWFRKAQSLYLALESKGRTKTFGGIPGDVEPYGWSLDAEGSVYAVVNPAQSVEEIQLPAFLVSRRR